MKRIKSTSKTAQKQVSKSKSTPAVTRQPAFRTSELAGEIYENDSITHSPKGFKDAYEKGRTRLSDDEFQKLVGPETYLIERFSIGMDYSTKYTFTGIDVYIWGDLGTTLLDYNNISSPRIDCIHNCYVRFKKFAWKVKSIKEAIVIVEAIRLFEKDQIDQIDRELEAQDRIDRQLKLEARRKARRKSKR